jgi:hypothetical protein
MCNGDRTKPNLKSNQARIFFLKYENQKLFLTQMKESIVKKKHKQPP